MTKSEAVGELLRRLRHEAGLSLRQLEERSGIDRGAISRLENGQAPRSSQRSLTKLAEALSIDPRRLYKAAGITDADAALPSLRPYLRAKYSHLPAAKVDEMVAFFETIEAEQAQARSSRTRRDKKR